MAEQAEPRKLAVIGHCAQCPHYVWVRSKMSGTCGKNGERITFAYGIIPDWCPLPDAKEKEKTNDTPR